jgi:hypothetical protein
MKFDHPTRIFYHDRVTEIIERIEQHAVRLHQLQNDDLNVLFDANESNVLGERRRGDIDTLVDMLEDVYGIGATKITNEYRPVYDALKVAHYSAGWDHDPMGHNQVINALKRVEDRYA